jgi:hypothetical protein
VLVVHVVLQAPVPHAYGAHATFVGVTQALLVLHVAAGVSVVPVHTAATQVVPEAYFRQTPLPLHDPSVPHVAAP